MPGQAGGGVMVPVLCLWLACGGAATAQEHPAMQPTRDVAVTYTTGLSGSPLRMSWLVARHLSRSDIARGTWVLSDEVAHSSLAVNDPRKVVLAMPSIDPTRIGMQPDASFTREGEDTVAGQGCTTWGIHAQGMDAKACVTVDGVLLRTDALGMTLTATEVMYAPQDPARFQVPTGYHRQGTP